MTANPESIEVVPFMSRLRSDLHAEARAKADELDWSLNSLLNEAVSEFLERRQERDTSSWAQHGWEVMSESGCCGKGFHIEVFVSLPNMVDADQKAYELQDLLSRTATEFGGREVCTRILALGGMEMDHR